MIARYVGASLSSGTVQQVILFHIGFTSFIVFKFPVVAQRKPLAHFLPNYYKINGFIVSRLIRRVFGDTDLFQVTSIFFGILLINSIARIVFDPDFFSILASSSIFKVTNEYLPDHIRALI